MGRDIIAFLILLLVIVSYYLHGEPVLPAVTVFLGLAFAVALRGRRERVRMDFVNQLKSHRRELRQGGTVVVDQMLLRYDSVLTTYFATVGAFLSSVDIASPYHLYTGEDRMEPLVYSLFSLCFGWWHFPHGPLLTVGYIQKNLRGGDRITVAMLIDSYALRRLEAEMEKENSARRKHGASLDKEVAAKELARKIIRTGPGSKSEKMLEKGTSTFQEQSYYNRLIEFESPKPLGVRFRDGLIAKAKDSYGKHQDNKAARKLRADPPVKTEK